MICLNESVMPEANKWVNQWVGKKSEPTSCKDISESVITRFLTDSLSSFLTDSLADLFVLFLLLLNQSAKESVDDLVTDSELESEK